MNFSELESLMSSRGVTSLADIARTLNTTPQAVSNWKARNQVPYHIVATLNKTTPPADSPQSSTQPQATPYTTHYSPFINEEDTGSLSDILITIANQIKVIFLTTFISVFFTFTYVQFIEQPLYVSKVTILLPEEEGVNLGGLAGFASQFGVNVPTGIQADLSSPSLFPELIKSRTFAEKILQTTPDNLERMFFCNSGTEAVEAAIKFARYTTKREKILHCEHSYHGLTLGALALNGEDVFREGFGPLLPGCSSVPFNDLERLETALANKDVAAFFIEPIQGKGVNLPDDNYLKEAQRLCHQYGTFLMSGIYKFNILTTIHLGDHTISG